MGPIRFRLRRTTAVVVGVAMVLAMTATPASADAAPARDPSKFACPPNLPNPFTDIAGSVHETDIRCGFLYGFFNGTSSTTFSPEADMTRGQYASILARAVAHSGNVDVNTTDAGFTDIAGNVHRDAINFLANIGDIRGTTSTTFNPDAPITREQAASLGARLLPLPPDAPDAFVDDDGSIHEADINALAAVGLASGVDSTHFDPLGTVSRGAAASFLVRGEDFAVETQLSFPIGPSAVVRAALTGGDEVPGPGDANGVATVELDRSSVPGMLCMTFDIDGALSGDATAAHVHQGAAGVAGPIVLTLPTPNVVANEPTLDSRCVSGLSEDTIAEVFANPSDYYVNIHTTDHPDGAVRGQLTTNQTELATLLSSSEEVPGPGEAGASGADFLDVMADGTTICSFMLYNGAGTPMAAHVHKAAAGKSGPIVITLPPFTDGQASDGCIGGLDPALLADISAHPENYYVNIHTDAFPNGAERGQLQPHPSFATALAGSAEVPGPGDSDGSGEAFVDLIGGSVLCVAIHVRGTDAPTAAHIHQAASGAAGPVVVTLPAPIFNHVYNCMDIDPALYTQIAADPAGFYVNVHTTDFPKGAMRGQLGPIVAPSGYGAAAVQAGTTASRFAAAHRNS